MRKFLFAILPLSIFAIASCTQKSRSNKGDNQKPQQEASSTIEPVAEEACNTIDSSAYDAKMKFLANGDTTGRWSIKTKCYPSGESILPYHRIVAYYGNLYSKRMGILGEYPPKELWKRLNSEVKAWEEADPSTPVIPAIHYIAIVAQGNPQKDGTYRYRMPQVQIDSVLSIAKMGNAIVFLDIQVALSNLKAELPTLEKYLKLPNVHLGIDPEFSMKEGNKPGTKIGSFNADDINYCSEYLAKLVKDNHLTPKVMIVHRFTQGMIKEYKRIRLHPEVQLVMNMDGWGSPILKFSTYKRYIYKEPVQFTGFKLFYKNDLKNPPHKMLTPKELLKLTPHPIYIQYQ